MPPTSDMFKPITEGSTLPKAKGKPVLFYIDEAEQLKVKALMPILKTKARTKVYKKALEMAYNTFKSSGQIKG